MRSHGGVQPRPAPPYLLGVVFFLSLKDRPWPFPLFLFPIHLSFRFIHSLSWFLSSSLMFIPSLIAALGLAVSSAFAQQPGSFVTVGDTLVSAMMVCRQISFAKFHR